MRLTEKDKYGHYYTNKSNCRNIWSLDGKKLEGEFFENQTLAIDGEAIDKLGQLEDIEEELGIDLITLFKALKNGVYVKMDGYIDFHRVGIDENTQLRTFSFSQIDGVQFDYFLDFENYGKTWALTKGELE